MWLTDVMNHSSEVDSEGYLISANRPPSERLRSFLKNFAIVHYGWVVSTSLTPNSDSRVEGAGRPLEEQPHFNPEDEGTRGAMSFYNHLSNSVSANKSKLLVVHFPLSYVVHRQDMIRWRHLGVGDVDTQIVVNDRFCGYLNQVAIPCLNITRDLIDGAAVSDSRLYYWLDIHWTAKGNHIAAEAVARHLTKDQD